MRSWEWKGKAFRGSFLDHPVSDELHANPSLPVLPQPNINPNLLSVDCRQEHSCSVVWFLSLWRPFTFFSAFLVFVVVVEFFLRSLVSHHVRFLCLAWFKGSHLESPLLIVLALFYHSVPQRAEESSVPPCCHVSPHCTTAIIAV